MSLDLVQKHFDKKAQDFDDIYTGQKSSFGRYLDKILRWDMEKRFNRTIEECGDITGKTILDVGCGSGRFMLALHKKNPKLITGLDFAPKMLEIAEKLLKKDLPDTPTKLIEGEYGGIEFKEPFDIIIAIGLFDYIDDAPAMLKKMRKDTKEKIIASFPVKGTFRAFIRKIRLGLYKCPVYYFSEEDVKKLFTEAGFKDIKMEKFGQLIFAAAH
ncbi:methyltransferase domain-containing protein [bacterium]|nr:methyltransferase domain-containing protein [bacterium]